jgi:hypothetical protein
MYPTTDLSTLFEGVASYESPDTLVADYDLGALGFDEAASTPFFTASSPECLQFSASLVGASVTGTLAVHC